MCEGVDMQVQSVRYDKFRPQCHGSFVTRVSYLLFILHILLFFNRFLLVFCSYQFAKQTLFMSKRADYTKDDDYGNTKIIKTIKDNTEKAN